MTEGRKRPGGHSGKHPLRDNPWSGDPKQRPPFPKGQTLSLRHGAHYEVALKPVAKKLEADLLAVAPWCARPAFAWAVKAWAHAEAMCEAYRAWFAEKGLRDEEDQPIQGLVQWDRAEARAAKLRSKLSLDPQSLATLLNKLADAEASGGTRAVSERQAISREIADLEDQVLTALKQRELGKGDGDAD